ncbi:MAG: metallophosphoesterase family protein, partial [Holophagales bacterium]|nr:metallophosphoesterase family protein [Holophagales bacterium]
LAALLAVAFAIPAAGHPPVRRGDPGGEWAKTPARDLSFALRAASEGASRGEGRPADGAFGPGSPMVVRGPYLQTATATSIVVRWRTDVPTPSRIRYGTDAATLPQVVKDPQLATEHSLRLEGLSPESTYFYAVELAGPPTPPAEPDGPPRRESLGQVYSFRTPPETGRRRPARLWVIGDSGTADDSARRVRDAFYAYTSGQPPDLWLMLGDNAYATGTDAEYQAAVFEMYPDLLATTSVWPTLGNHDGLSADSASQTGPYYDIFTLPTAGEAGGVPSGTEAYYSFDHGNLHLICLDSFETDRDPGSPMLRWLEEDLAATDAEWIVAYWHHPPYSKGSHDSDVETWLIDMRENALPLLEARGVDLVLAGHSHSYERSFLLDGHYGPSTTLHPSMVLDGGDGSPGGDGPYSQPTPGAAPHEGTVYVVAGSSGKVTPAPLDHPVMVFSGEILGSVVIDIDGLEMTATFLDDLGQARDVFRLIQGGGNRIFADGFESGNPGAWSGAGSP